MCTIMLHILLTAGLLTDMVSFITKWIFWIMNQVNELAYFLLHPRLTGIRLIAFFWCNFLNFVYLIKITCPIRANPERSGDAESRVRNTRMAGPPKRVKMHFHFLFAGASVPLYYLNKVLMRNVQSLSVSPFFVRHPSIRSRRQSACLALFLLNNAYVEAVRFLPWQ